MDKKEVAALSRKIRKSRDWTQGQLANCIGVSYATVNRWETERTVPQRAQLEALKNLNKGKYNAVVLIIQSTSDEEETVNICVVTPDSMEHEVIIPKKYFDSEEKDWMPAEYFVHPSCCEHPDGCPGGSRTDKMLEKFNE